jgi:hypothetical protein
LLSRGLVALIVVFLLGSALLFMPLPFPPTYAGRTIENAGHTPLFFIVTLGVLLALRSNERYRGIKLYLVAGLVGIGSGFLSEVIQRPLARDASWEDVFADALGAVCALAVFAMFDRRSKLERWQRLVALFVAVACIAVYLAPIVTMTRAYLHRNGQFPVLASFHSPQELYWTLSFGVRREIVNDALEVEFVAEDTPGIAFHEPVPDWTKFRTLVIDVQNPAATPLNLGVRVHDRRHNRRFNDRFNRRFDIAPGERRTLRISLEDVRHGPRSRLMDLKRISDITLFKGEKNGSRQLRIHAIRLE